MAKRIKEEVVETAKTKGSNENFFNDLMGEIKKINPYANFLSEETLSNVSDYISTGCPALNGIISGDLYKGIPVGRVTCFAGEPQSGKTFITMKILAEAQKKGITPIIFDSEFDKDKNLANGMGLDPSKIMWIPITNIEDATIQVVRVLDKIIADKRQGKAILVIDSLGNVSSKKESDDVTNEKNASDMGLDAKATKRFFRQITGRLAIAQCAMVVIQHVYADPSAYMPSVIKKVRGGSGPQYMATVSIQVAMRKEEQDEKNTKDTMITEAKKYSGGTLRFFTVKNRLIAPFLEIENYLSWKSGLDKYSGLKVLAENHGVILKDGHRWKMEDGTMLGFYNDWRHDEKLWEDRLMPLINKKINEAYPYCKLEGDITQLEKEIETIEDDVEVT